MITCQLTIENPTGFHERTAIFWLKAASKFKSHILVQYEGHEVDGKSIIELISLGLMKGATFYLIADGPDEAAAVEALKEVLVELAVKGE